MANRTRYTANLVSANNLYVDTVNDRLGVGTTTPDDKLHVVGNLRVTGAFKDSSGDAGGTGQFLASTITGTNWVDSPVTIVGTDGLLLYNNNGTPSGAPQAYYDDINGRIGIGTTSPTSKLHVVGDVSIGSIIDIVPYDTLNSGTLSWEGSAGQLFSITNNLTTGSIFSVNDVSGIPSIDVNADGTIQLGPYGGNIGVGTTTPSDKLHVVGNLRVTGTIKDSSGDAGGAGQFLTSTGTGTNWITSSAVVNRSTDNENLVRYPTFESSDVAGIVNELFVAPSKLQFRPSTGTLSATVFTSLSDRTQKEDIRPIENAIGIVNQLTGVRYNWKNSINQPSIGLIAQDVEEVIPEVVVEMADGLKSVSYGNIVAVLIEAIKEQQVRIEELEDRLNA